MDASASWTVLAINTNDLRSSGSYTSKLLFRYFREISPPQNWRDHFGFSRRAGGPLTFLESIATVPLQNGCDLDMPKTLRLTWLIKDLIGLRTNESPPRPLGTHRRSGTRASPQSVATGHDLHRGRLRPTS